jgi:hypothetical protein
MKCEHNVTSAREELKRIMQEEIDKGKSKGKSREYYKKNSKEYERKQELKQIIANNENAPEYKEVKKEIEIQEGRVRNFQFGFTQYDSSITEQFNRISEYLYEITRTATSFFLSKNNKSNDLPDISFRIDVNKLTDYYNHSDNCYINFSIAFPNTLIEKLTEMEKRLLVISVNSIFMHPQGRLGDFSEQNILEIIKTIGEHLVEGSDKQTLRDYYLYRIGKSEHFNFPQNQVLASLIVFLIKLDGYDQINKMLIAKNVSNRQIAFMFYGIYVGFANMPKTFTNAIFDSGNLQLLKNIDEYLFSQYLT